jgi:endonuclease III
MNMGETDQLVWTLLDQHGQTYAEQAGIKLADKPGPLYQLLVLATLLSAQISADVAVAAAHELFTAGYRTPNAMLAASWQDRVDALGRGHYRRYDERTATALGDGAALLRDRWHGDLRKLRDQAETELDGDIAELLTKFPGIGPAGASIFLREVQEAWPGVSPYVDAVMRRGARRIGLPDSTAAVGSLLAGSGHPARLAAALVRIALSHRAATEIAATTGRPTVS